MDENGTPAGLVSSAIIDAEWRERAGNGPQGERPVLIYRRRDVQLFGFGPDRRSRKQALGVALRLRGRDRWRHVSAHLYWPRRDLRRSRGTVSFEVATWLTGPGTTSGRLTFKTFARIKLGLGGRR